MGGAVETGGSTVVPPGSSLVEPAVVEPAVVEPAVELVVEPVVAPVVEVELVESVIDPQTFNEAL